MDEAKELYELLQITPLDSKNKYILNQINNNIQNGEYDIALDTLKNYLASNNINVDSDKKHSDIDFEELEKREENDYDFLEPQIDENVEIYPDELKSPQLEKDFIGMLLVDPKLIAKYYIIYDECYFENKIYLEIYKGILFTEGEAYAPTLAKNNFNFAKNNYVIYQTKSRLKYEYENKSINIEKVYIELKKLFILRKNYISMPIRSIQTSIINITNYKLYDQMSEDEVKSAVNQVMVTDKFKQSVLSKDLTKFFTTGNNNLTNGLSLPFKILSSVFKGVRRGETTAYAMPSNAGKSRFTINLAAYIAFVHKKKVLVISNEMSEEKMKLCLITTVLNNSAYQKMHGINIKKSESELLDFKFRPDNVNSCIVDSNGYVLKEKNETQNQFVERLLKISEEFRRTVAVTNWVNDQTENSIYFANITNHTNDELQKIIMNYYYKEDIHYMFYDTLKTDTDNIGNGEEIKKTATILSNLAQNFGLYIGSTIQLTENSTLPINLNINDLAVSRTVKEVLDTLCLLKQINNDCLDDYEFTEKEVDSKAFDLEKFEDPDVRYYACVVDKNRAGAKPKVLFRLNLAYNHWEELGYLRLKQ